MQPSSTSIPARHVSRRRLYQQIADDIERLILNGTFEAGTRLPSEQELSEHYGVSRNVIREALKSLKGVGLVSIRTGSGTYVRRPSMEQVTDALTRYVKHRLDEFSIRDFYEIRRMIEPENARLAAQRASEDDILAIQLQIKTMEESQDDIAVWSDADINYHLSIASATQNPLVVNILNTLIDPLRAVISVGYTEPEGTNAGLEAHHRIADAIQSGSGEEAYQAMLTHLIDSEQRLIKVDPHLNNKEVIQ